MTVIAHTDVADFDTNSGVVNTNTAFHSIAPSFAYDAGDYVITDIGRFNNEAFKFYMRMDDVTATNFKIMLGCNAVGNGRAIQFDFSSTQKWVRLVTTSGIDQAFDTVLQETDIHSKRIINNDFFVEIKVIISNNKIKVYYQGLLVIDYQNFTIVGNNWGFANLTGSSLVYTSDMFYVYDQIIYGNVNLNGAPDSRGVVIMYNQSTYDVVEYTVCDPNGEYMIFIDDQPENFNKYFIYGFVNGVGTVQPRGVSNITI